jgi:hypothetical protein
LWLKYLSQILKGCHESKAENIPVGPVINFKVGRLKDGIKGGIFRRSQRGVKNKFFKSMNINYLLCVLCLPAYPVERDLRRGVVVIF